MIGYYRLSGGGNDFLALVEPGSPPDPTEITAWCRRGVSLGADGLFVLERKPGISPTTLRMRYFNADGLEAELCLNGTRCAARLALELGWIRDPKAAFAIETGAGDLTARAVDSDRIEVELPVPAEAPRQCRVAALDRFHDGWEVVVGVPHFVIEVASGLQALELADCGPALRYHEHFAPRGANVDWIELRPGGFAIRSWERGVEAETLACGSGVLAACAAAVASGRLELPAEVQTRGGFVFSVRGETAGAAIRSWSLSGDARIVARGEIYPGAVARPS